MRLDPEPQVHEARPSRPMPRPRRSCAVSATSSVIATRYLGKDSLNKRLTPDLRLKLKATERDGSAVEGKTNMQMRGWPGSLRPRPAPRQGSGPEGGGGHRSLRASAELQHMAAGRGGGRGGQAQAGGRNKKQKQTRRSVMMQVVVFCELLGTPKCEGLAGPCW